MSTDNAPQQSLRDVTHDKLTTYISALHHVLDGKIGKHDLPILQDLLNVLLDIRRQDTDIFWQWVVTKVMSSSTLEDAVRVLDEIEGRKGGAA